MLCKQTVVQTSYSVHHVTSLLTNTQNTTIYSCNYTQMTTDHVLDACDSVIV